MLVPGFALLFLDHWLFLGSHSLEELCHLVALVLELLLHRDHLLVHLLQCFGWCIVVAAFASTLLSTTTAIGFALALATLFGLRVPLVHLETSSAVVGC